MAPLQLIDATFEGSVADTEPITGEVLNQPLVPSGVNDMVTTGGVVSVMLGFTITATQEDVDDFQLTAELPDP